MQRFIHKIFYSTDTNPAPSPTSGEMYVYLGNDTLFRRLDSAGLDIPLAEVGKNYTVGLHINSTATPSILNITAEEIALKNSQGLGYIAKPAASFTVDSTFVGAGGLDAAVTFPLWLHIWAIGDGSVTPVGLLSASSTAPTLPTGYSFKAYLGAAYAVATKNFLGMTQSGNTAWLTQRPSEAQYLTAGTAATFTAGVLTPFVPTTAATCINECLINASFANFQLSFDGTNIMSNIAAVPSSGAAAFQIETPLNASRQISYQRSAGTGTFYLTSIGWRF